jgi:ankyrin repeat protein
VELWIFRSSDLLGIFRVIGGIIVRKLDVVVCRSIRRTMLALSAPIAIQASSSPQIHEDFPCSVDIAEGASEAMNPTAAVLAATLMLCREALVKSPAASRSALAKHRASIDPTVAKTLEIVGTYMNEHGRTSLHEAAMKGDAATVESLLEAGADINVKDTNGATPLDLAIDDTCRALLHNHAAVIIAIGVDPVILVSAAVAHCVTLSASEDTVSTTALPLRSYHFDPSFLWAPHAARTAVTAWAHDACILHLAAATQPNSALPDDCAGDVFEFLKMKRMARTDALHVATHCSSPEAQVWVRAVVTAAATVAIAAKATVELIMAADEGDVATVRECLEKGASVDVRGERRRTALIEASNEGHITLVKLLLEAGADKDAKNDRGWTAFVGASLNGHDVIVRLLLEAGADKEATNHRGETALMIASSSGHTDIVKLLLGAGADLEAKSDTSRTALMCASNEGHTAIVELLLKAGADKDAKNYSGSTALMMASEVGQSATVQLLLDAGADMNAMNDRGWTVLMKASLEGCTAVVKLLLEAG